VERGIKKASSELSHKDDQRGTGNRWYVVVKKVPKTSKDDHRKTGDQWYVVLKKASSKH